MGEGIRKIKMVFPENGFIASKGLKENKQAYDIFKDLFGSGRTIEVDTSKVSDEEIVEKLGNSIDRNSKEDQTQVQEEIKKKFCIDFDGTCVTEEFPNVGMDAPGAVRVLKALVNNGHKLILWTARSEKTLEDALEWFRGHKIELYAVNDDPHPLEGYPIPRKVIPAWYIDDRNLCTPMIEVYHEGKYYKVVDWNKVEKELVSKKIIPRI